MSDTQIPDGSNRLTLQGLMAAIGAAPLILALAPCAVMCGLGACAMCKSKSCDNKSSPTEASLPRD